MSRGDSVRRVRDERGSASVLVAALLGVVVLLTGVALLVGGYELAYRRARAAADLAAVSGATTFQQGGDPCAQARRTARDNGARVLSCEQVGDLVEYVVTVRVGIEVRTRLRRLPARVEAEAHAGTAP